MSGLMVPGRIPVEHEYYPAPFATPANVTATSPAGVKVMVVGGFTRLEQAALQIAASIAREIETEVPPQRAKAIARSALDIAHAVLDACAEREGEPLPTLTGKLP